VFFVLDHGQTVALRLGLTKPEAKIKYEDRPLPPRGRFVVPAAPADAQGPAPGRAAQNWPPLLTPFRLSPELTRETLRATSLRTLLAHL